MSDAARDEAAFLDTPAGVLAARILEFFGIGAEPSEPDVHGSG